MAVPTSMSQAFRRAAIGNGPWSDLFIGAYFLSTLHLFLYLFHQYKLDWSTVMRDQLLWRRSANLISYDSKLSPADETLLQQLDATIHHQNSILDLIDQPLRHLAFFAEFFFWCVFMHPFSSFVCLQVYFNFYQPHNNYLLRILIDHEQEVDPCRLLVREQVEELLFSHRNSNKTITITQMDCSDKHTQWKLIRKLEARPKRDRYINRELLEMEARDKLLPDNRRSEWVRGWLPYYSGLALLGACSSAITPVMILQFIYFSHVLRSHVDAKLWLDYSATDWLVVLESGIFLFALACSILFFGINFSFGALDQNRLAKHLIGEHEASHLESQRRLLHRLGCGWSLEACCCDLSAASFRQEFNVQLFELVMRYRIFTRQLASQRDIFGASAANTVISFALVPVLSSLHAPYFDITLEGIKNFMAVVSTLTLTILIVGLWVLCALFSRCVQLHQAQLKLSAHMVQVDQFCPNLFNTHLTSLLRRETSSHQRLVVESAVSFAGIRFTYASVLKFYFWFSIVVLAAILGPNSLNDSLSQTPRRLGGAITPQGATGSPTIHSAFSSADLKYKICFSKQHNSIQIKERLQRHEQSPS